MTRTLHKKFTRYDTKWQNWPKLAKITPKKTNKLTQNDFKMIKNGSKITQKMTKLKQNWPKMATKKWHKNWIFMGHLAFLIDNNWIFWDTLMCFYCKGISPVAMECLSWIFSTWALSHNSSTCKSTSRLTNRFWFFNSIIYFKISQAWVVLKLKREANGLENWTFYCLA